MLLELGLEPMHKLLRFHLQSPLHSRLLLLVLLPHHQSRRQLHDKGQRVQVGEELELSVQREQGKAQRVLEDKQH